MLTITVPGRPVPAARINYKGRFGTQAQRYLAYQQDVRLRAKTAARCAGLTEPIKGPIAVSIRLFIAGNSEGDVDNYAKGILDACNTTRAYQGIWNDDKQVVRLSVEKFKVERRGEQRVEIAVTSMSEIKSGVRKTRYY